MIKDPSEYGLTVMVETIDADTANQYLDNNAKHREIKQVRVDRYIADFGEGRLEAKWQGSYF
jgi:hypothetical protein